MPKRLFEYVVVKSTRFPHAHHASYERSLPDEFFLPRKRFSDRVNDDNFYGRYGHVFGKNVLRISRKSLETTKLVRAIPILPNGRQLRVIADPRYNSKSPWKTMAVEYKFTASQQKLFFDRGLWFEPREGVLTWRK